jgi:cytochrome P450
MASLTTETPPLKKPTYIHGWPIFGSQLALRHDRLNFLQRLAQTGDICSFHFGSALYFLVSTPQLIQSILVEHAANFYYRGRFLRRAFIGNGLIISDGEYHRRQRKIVATLFQPRHLASYADVIMNCAENFPTYWQDGEVIDLHQQMIDLSMSIFSKVLFNLEIRPGDALIRAMDIALAHSAQVLFSLTAIPVSWPTPYNRRLREARLVLQKHLRVAFDQRHLNPQGTLDKDLLSLLSQATDEDGNKMSDKQILDESRVLFIAGFETTAMALIWTWYLLCKNPDCYQKVLQEVDSVLEGRSPTYADLPRLPYCLQVFKEVLRLYPPAPMIRREALHDIEIDGYQIPQGGTILVSAYTLHRQPEYFPNPEQFDPERFSPEREREIPRYAYLPFGAGPRVCLGNHFAMMEGHLQLATLAQRVIFTLVPGQPPVNFDTEHNLALRPKGGIAVRVQKRERTHS